jgi:hypothetical protein
MGYEAKSVEAIPNGIMIVVEGPGSRYKFEVSIGKLWAYPGDLVRMKKDPIGWMANRAMEELETVMEKELNRNIMARTSSLAGYLPGHTERNRLKRERSIQTDRKKTEISCITVKNGRLSKNVEGKLRTTEGVQPHLEGLVKEFRISHMEKEIKGMMEKFITERMMEPEEMDRLDLSEMWRKAASEYVVREVLEEANSDYMYLTSEMDGTKI